MVKHPSSKRESNGECMILEVNDSPNDFQMFP